MQSGNEALPAYLSNAGGSGSNAMGYASGIAGILQSIFGNSDEPYEAQMEQLKQYLSKAEDVQNPYMNAGKTAIGNYQNWLSKMNNPTSFINNTMSQYQSSPWARNLQNQALRSAQAYGSASGLSGSTPMMQQIQQNANNISSSDMNNWLSKVLGINTEYGQGNQNLMSQGASAANSLSDLYGNYGQLMGKNAYDKEAASNNDFMSGIMGIADILF